MTGQLRTEMAQLELQARLTAEYQREMTPVPGTCLLAYRGSVTHGLYTGDGTESTFDDVDLMGVVIGESRHYLGLYKWGEQEYGLRRECLEIKQGRWDLVVYEYRKLVGLLLKGNPNVVSLLWLRPQDYLIMTPAFQALIDHRHLFLSRHVYNAFGAYAHDQLVKMESRDPAELRDYLALTAEAKRRGIHPNHKREELPYPEDYDHDSGEARNAAAHSNDVLTGKLRHYMKKGESTGYMGDKRKQSILLHQFDRKMAAHCVRLLRMALEFKRTGELVVLRPDAEELLDIKTGRSGWWTLERVKQHANELYAEMEAERASSTLPEEPDYVAADRLLVEVLGRELGADWELTA